MGRSEASPSPSQLRRFSAVKRLSPFSGCRSDTLRQPSRLMSNIPVSPEHIQSLPILFTTSFLDKSMAYIDCYSCSA